MTMGSFTDWNVRSTGKSRLAGIGLIGNLMSVGQERSQSAVYYVGGGARLRLGKVIGYIYLTGIRHPIYLTPYTTLLPQLDNFTHRLWWWRRRD